MDQELTMNQEPTMDQELTMDEEVLEEDLHSESEDEPLSEPFETIPEKEEISENDWDQMFQKGTFKKHDMDMMIMVYFLSKELPIVAEVFHRESGCPLDLRGLPHIGAQKIVRELILNYQFDDAIRVINETQTPVFFSRFPVVHFMLEQQKMIEMCRKRDFKAALDFSRDLIVKWGDFKDKCDDIDIDIKKECRKTLLLMMFGNDKESPVSSLLNLERLFRIASYAVEKMIEYHCRKPGNLVEIATKMLIAEEYKLYEVVDFPYFNFYSGYPEPTPHTYIGLPTL